MNKTKWYIEKVLFFVLAQMHYIQCKQFSEANVTLQIFPQISDFNIFLNTSAGHMQPLGL